MVDKYAENVTGNPDEQSILSKMAYASWNPIPYISEQIKQSDVQNRNDYKTPFAGDLSPKLTKEAPPQQLGPDQGFYGQIGQPQVPIDTRMLAAQKAVEGMPEYIPDTKYLAEAVDTERKIANMADIPAKAYEKAIKTPAAEYESELKGTQAELRSAKAKGEEAYRIKEDAIKQVLAEHPLLSSKQVRDSYSFGEKLLLGALGGLGHNPNLFNQLVERKASESKEDFENALTKLTSSANTSLDHVNYTYDKAISLSNVDARVLGAAKEAALRKQQEATNPIDRLKAQTTAANAEWSLEQAKKYSQDLKNQQQSLIDSAYASASMDPNFISLGVVDAKGNPLGAYPKPGYEKEVRDAAPQFQAVYGPNGENQKLVNYLERSGDKNMKDKEATALFNQIIQTSPFKLEPGDYQKLGLDPTSNYTNGEMLYYLKKIQNMNVLKFNNMTNQPSIDPRLIRAQLKKR
jgi:hypothetical protein